MALCPVRSLLSSAFVLSLGLACCTDDSSSGSPVVSGKQDASLDAFAPDGIVEVSADTKPKDSGLGGAGGSATDAGSGGNGGNGGGAPDATVDSAVPDAPAQYPSDATHSPITPWVVARLNDILAQAPSSRRDVFLKVGDSITASGSFLNCFAGSSVDLGSHSALQPTIDLYTGSKVQSTTSFDRTSLSVEVGRTAYWAMSGDPSPLEKEIAATQGSVAVTMYGTNDIGWFGTDHVHTLTWYYDNLFSLVDALCAAGVIPILSTIPPRDDDSSIDAWVPVMNAVIRGMAQGRQVPLVDFHREIQSLPKHGLGNDGVHPNGYSGGACKLTSEGLQFGYNLRNLLTLEALDRVRRAVLSGGGAIDSQAPVLSGEGTAASPFLVSGSVFTHLNDTSKSTSRKLNTYSGCGSTANESGPEFLYKITVTKASRIKALVLDRGQVDVDIHLLKSNATEAACVARADTMVTSDLASGTYYLSLDTFTSNGAEHSGEYLLVVLLCNPGEAACE